jgi:Zn-dependent protease/predicted transcriptional regulator
MAREPRGGHARVMKPTVTLGRVRGIEVGIHWSVFIVLALIAVTLASMRLPDDVAHYSDAAYWFAAVVTAVVFLASILAHEMSHSLVAVRRGVQVEGITLWALGGVSQLRDEARTAGDELRIAVVGPLTSLAIGIIGTAVALALDAADASPLVVSMIAWLAGINIVLAVFNLVPALPLDGGRVLHALIWAWKKDPLRATNIAATAGRLFGAALIALGFGLFISDRDGLWYALLGWFLLNAATAEQQHAVMKRRLGSLEVRDVMTPDPVTVPADIDVQRFVDDYVLRAPYSTFPVVNRLGDVVGLLPLRRVKQVPRAAWPTTRVGEVACPLSQVPTVRPDEPLVDALERIRDGCAEGRELVMTNGRVIGIVSPSDVSRVLERTELTPRRS